MPLASTTMRSQCKDMYNRQIAHKVCTCCREAKKCKAYDMYQLLARMVTFRANIGQLLGSVRTHLPEASQPRVYNKLSSLLQHASRGILANPTAQPQDLMVFVHGVLEGGLAQQEAAQEAAEAEATAAVHAFGRPAHSSATPARGLLCGLDASRRCSAHSGC